MQRNLQLRPDVSITMDIKERLLYLSVICVSMAALTITAVGRRRAESSASFSHIEIQDTAENTRIIIGTDSNGTAEIRFVGGNLKKLSYIQQYSDGSTSMRFAGRANEPSIMIDAMQSGPGPVVSLRGNSDDQMIYLGAADQQDDIPSVSPQAYGWGLHVPAGGFQPPYAAIGANRDSKTGKIQGFVHPEK
jgi:hypothetical protein